MLNVILYQPEIAPNTGNIIRLCANTGTRLHLVGPLGFTLDDSRLRRAGLDYHELADVHQYSSWEDWYARHPKMMVWAFSTRGAKPHFQANFNDGDGLLYGPESRGLPAELLEQLGGSRVLRLPMIENSRSMNLSNAVSVGLYEGLRQLGFPGLN
jgi:tRNA (cytidine/uridine-2'-O-)-methyltransferase